MAVDPSNTVSASDLKWSTSRVSKIASGSVSTGVHQHAGSLGKSQGDAGGLGIGNGERYEQVPSPVDQLWVLDVNGRRLLVDATYSPDTSQADRAELDQIVKSLHFGAHQLRGQQDRLRER